MAWGAQTIRKLTLACVLLILSSSASCALDDANNSPTAASKTVSPQVARPQQPPAPKQIPSRDQSARLDPSEDQPQGGMEKIGELVVLVDNETAL